MRSDFSSKTKTLLLCTCNLEYYRTCCTDFSGRQTCGRTSRGHPGGREGYTGFFAFIYIARIIQPFYSLVDCMKSNIVYLRINLSPLLVGHAFLFLFFCEEKYRFL